MWNCRDVISSRVKRHSPCLLILNLIFYFVCKAGPATGGQVHAMNPRPPVWTATALPLNRGSEMRTPPTVGKCDFWKHMQIAWNALCMKRHHRLTLSLDIFLALSLGVHCFADEVGEGLDRWEWEECKEVAGPIIQMHAVLSCAS